MVGGILECQNTCDCGWDTMCRNAKCSRPNATWLVVKRSCGAAGGGSTCTGQSAFCSRTRTYLWDRKVNVCADLLW